MLVVCVRSELAPDLSSDMIRVRQIGKRRSNTFVALPEARFRTSSPTASTAFERQVVVMYSSIWSRTTSYSLSSSAAKTPPHVCCGQRRLAHSVPLTHQNTLQCELLNLSSRSARLASLLWQIAEEQ